MQPQSKTVLMAVLSAVLSAPLAPADELEEVFVIGSRIPRGSPDQAAPTIVLSEDDLSRSGLTGLGAVFQQLPLSGSAINTRFNVPGNLGFPQDGSGIGAGAAQMSLRNLGAKRTLVLVNSRRWIAGASASGVPGAVDLNSLPANVIERVEILPASAAASYGSDAIGGVVNLITYQDFEGLRLGAQTGNHLSHGDGEASRYSLLWGGGNAATRLMASVHYADEGKIYTSARAQSAFPAPYATSCEAGGCSSFTPQGRFLLGPNFGYADLALNDGVLNDGADNLPVFDPADPYGGDFHRFTSADRFNFNGDRYNFLMTPNRRLNLYAQVSHEVTDRLRFTGKLAYNRRRSTTMGAPEPLCLGSACGNDMLRHVVIDARQPYNPFGVDLSVANGNLEFFGRRPLESGPRVFHQTVNTLFFSALAEGEFTLIGRVLRWDMGAAYGKNRGAQRKLGAHNAARLATALGDPSICDATPGCAPFNFFGGQGPDGGGSITAEMLDFVGYTQRDFSRQTLQDYTGNLSGELLSLPVGPLTFAAGFEHRRHRGWFRPDPVAERGETAGIPSGATQGGFDVTEFYGELNAPLAQTGSGVGHLELNLAARRSDYSSIGAESAYKLGVLWRPVADLTLRGAFSTGLRAPGIGELFGGATQEDFAFLDPCADVHGVIGAGNGGRDAPQPRRIVEACAALGLAPDLAQNNSQLVAVSAGNPDLLAETSQSYTAGFAYRPRWARSSLWVQDLKLSADYYRLDLDDAIQGRNPGDIITACVETLAPLFCDAVQRTGRGAVRRVENQLRNIGGIDAAGVDLALEWLLPPRPLGQLRARVNATRLVDFVELTANPDGSFAATDLVGAITSETFQRAFPKWRGMARLDWTRGGWAAGLTFRYVSSLKQPSGNVMGAEFYTDLLMRYRLQWREQALTVTLGVNNLLNNNPGVCDACGLVSLSPVAHDLPGVVGYARLSLER